MIANCGLLILIGSLLNDIKDRKTMQIAINAVLITLYEFVCKRKATFVSLGLILLSCQMSVRSNQLKLFQNAYALFWLIINFNGLQDFLVNYFLIYASFCFGSYNHLSLGDFLQQSVLHLLIFSQAYQLRNQPRNTAEEPSP